MSTLKEPRWILAIIIALVLTAMFVRLGSWQLERLDERKASNVLVEARSFDDPRPLEALIGQYGEGADALIHRQAIVTGRYRLNDEFFSVGRTYDDLSGTMVMTPLELDDGSTMIVVRGLVPPGTDGPPAIGYAPPAGTVTLVGRLDDGEEPLRIGEPDPDDGVLRSLSRVDLAYINTWLDGDVLPVSLTLTMQAPQNVGDTPFPIPPDELTEGRHLGYAVQWFAFALIVLFGVAMLVWKAGTSDVTVESDPEPAQPV
ncbi:MAG: SURF1 family protein [Actinomycetia bacterium]|nr:SURF1 family protein [Actinomycetes bacterium]